MRGVQSLQEDRLQQEPQNPDQVVVLLVVQVLGIGSILLQQLEGCVLCSQISGELGFYARPLLWLEFLGILM
ncbi:hypothetical protein DU15_0945 [Chlamydia trachomatis]|nr:hypothetical protein DU15_0945 [Chlamydia trachomatis]ROT52065.1 hypothetical protein DU16_0943 [Chlamydia trachomatis]ROT55923.1 hypothetical protein DU10_0945 [Chlamydia trachomatis]ROT58084.1 hypothetical protein DU07_0943 [Chlamydia trachomatis]ROT59626.1 hypothetical protein DU06_0944 [Chlamydia trachomatis]